MKKTAFLVVFLFLLSSFPYTNAQPWITVFEGRVKIGETLIVGEYQIKVTLEKREMKPYAIIYENDEIRKIARQGNFTEVGSIRLILGSYDVENGDIFVALQYKPPLMKEFSPKEGASFEIAGYSLEVIEASDESVLLNINGEEIEVKTNSTRIYGNLALEYVRGILKVYHADTEVRKEARKDYEVYCPFTGLKVKAGEQIQIPVEVKNNGNEGLKLQLRVISKPAGWEVKILDEGGRYEINEIFLAPRDSVTLDLLMEVPEDVSGTKSVRFAVGEEVEEISLNVVKEDSIDVIIPLLTIESEAGQKVAFPITLRGEGTVEVSVKEKPMDWNAYFIMNNQRVRSFFLEGEEQVVLFVEVPRSAELGEHQVRFSINGIEKSISVFVYKTHKGEPAKLHVNVKDEEGGFLQKAKIHIGNKTFFTDSYGKATIELKPGIYTATVEKEGYEKAEKDITLEDGEEKTLEITLTKLPYYFELEGSGDTVAVNTGSVGVYKLNVKNLGKNEDTYRLSLLDIPKEWSAEFYYAESPVRSIKLNSGESKEVALKLIPPFNAQPGEYNLTIAVKSSSGLQKKIGLVVKLIGEYRFEMYPETPALSVKAGKEGVTYVSLENAGTASITNIKFEISAPKGWDVKVAPQVIPELKSPYSGEGNMATQPREIRERLAITIKVPETAPAGTYQITITGKGDQAQVSTQIAVRVTQSSSSAYIGILILIAAFGGLILMMRRIGRR
ncbi:NEW3 domain-containing protein [Thermococcus aggregans]|uniref:NEW3 domain-containing protein n=1 Tax=Thermococcus aggregans TaxID=110163 RepID=A0A9E7SPV2_THEAG|nr:NEW3 domain-containing protein [Thermococcus aggregans]USS41516.1 NEW3 domain-containing protein [Thermococcus aggregans]